MKRNIFLTSLLSLFLTACGSGGSSSSSKTSDSSNISIDTTIVNNIIDPSPVNAKSIPANASPLTEDYYKYLWQFNESNTDFKTTYSINNNSHINIQKAWDLTKGAYTVGPNIGKAVKVAVIDDSFDTNHPDLKDNIYLTYNAKTQGTDVSPSNTENSHGTEVASFIASSIGEISSSSNSGLVGAAPQAKLILIKIDFNTGSLSEILRAYDYAKSQGVRVLNCSWGSSSGPSEAEIAKIKELKDAGITIIFASGNDNKNLDLPNNKDEAELADVIGVGASGVDNDVTRYSNYGSSIDLIASGGGSFDNTNTTGILSAYFTNTQTPAKGLSTSIDINKYTFTIGTSFSAPIVSGVSALMAAVNPKLTPAQIRTILIRTSDKVGSSNGASYDNSGFDKFRAYGKVNAYNAVKKAKDLYTP